MNIIKWLKENYKIALIIILIICIIIYYNWPSDTTPYENFIYGYWVGDEGFCEESDISSMMFFIGKADTTKGSTFTRKAHLVINNDVTNQTLDISYSQPPLPKKMGKYKIQAKLTFEEECDIPSDVTMEFDIIKGMLRIYKKDTMYGIFYKNNEVTNSLQ